MTPKTTDIVPVRPQELSKDARPGVPAIVEAAGSKRRLRDAGLSAKHFKCHSFRASTATNLLNQGVELADVQYLLGHADPRTTKLYDRRKLAVTRNIVERIAI